MRVIEITRFGGPETLCLSQRPVPAPGPGQVRVRVAASGVNPIDYKTRQGLGFVSAQIRESLPWVPGYDVAGWVEAAGPGADLPVGTAVCGMVNFPLGGGGYAEQVVCAAQDLVALPPGAHEVAHFAALPLAGLTAVQALLLGGDLLDRRLLVIGGGSAVGSIACQWALSAGARVSAVASRASGESLSAWGVTVLERETGAPWPAKGFDLVLDLVGGEAGQAGIAAVAEGGCLVTVPTVTAAALRAAGEAAGVSVHGMTVRPDRALLSDLVEAVRDGRLKVRVGGAHPAVEVAEVHRLLEAQQAAGKRLLVWEPVPGPAVI